MSNSVGQDFDLPLYLASADLDYTAKMFRDMADLLVTPGRRDGLSLVVSQHAGTPNMTVDITPGGAAVGGTTEGAQDVSGMYPQGVYAARLRTGCSVTIPTAPGSGSRTDAIYLQIADKTELGSGNDEAIIKVQSPFSVLPANAFLLATVAVGTSVTQIFNGNITVNPVLAQPPSQQTAIAVAVQNLKNVLRQSSPQSWGWGGVPYGWGIPNGGWNLAPGAYQVLNVIAGHIYAFKSTFAIDYITTGQQWRASLQVNSAVLGSEAYGRLEAAGVTVPVCMQEYWTCPATGAYSFATAFAGSGANTVMVLENFTTPSSQLIDVGTVGLI